MTALTEGAVAVLGDVTVDWAILSGRGVAANLELPYLWDRRGTASLSPMPGGAALIGRLIEAMSAGPVLAQELAPQARTDPRWTAVTRTFATWTTFPRSPGDVAESWRMSAFLGQEQGVGASPALPVPVHARVVVVDDANLGFRDDPENWKGLLEREGPSPRVVVRMAPPLAAGNFWRYLCAMPAADVTLCVSLGDLRKENAPVGQPLSWERTAEEVVEAARSRFDLNENRRVVVGIGLSGAVVVEASCATLVYDPAHLEGDWEAAHPGLPYGANAALVAAVATELQSSDHADFATAAARGLEYARQMHLNGLETASGEVRPGMPALPAKQGENSTFTCCRVESGAWTILGTHAGGDLNELATGLLLGTAGSGLEAVPAERMGAWVSVDRAEIESVRSVRHIIGEYLGQPSPPRPLSVAVFGPPGCGKSFAIKQMAAGLSHGSRKMAILEFNVSQFAGPESLASAFQRVRDCAVSGSLPLVFWDEFDSTRNGQELGWLAAFLAPMQDGEFLEASVTRPIGPAVFVFAGGTHAFMQSFRDRAAHVPSAKATDFLSRLRGFVDVLGPNPSGPSDQSFKIRRAFLLRQVLQRRAPQLAGGAGLAIDPGVAKAFLSVSHYRHGARSVEAIVEMSALSGRTQFTRSALPAPHQLDLHVDSAEFLALTQRTAGI